MKRMMKYPGNAVMHEEDKYCIELRCIPVMKRRMITEYGGEHDEEGMCIADGCTPKENNVKENNMICESDMLNVTTSTQRAELFEKALILIKNGNNKIALIKAIRTVYGGGLRETMDLVDKLTNDLAKLESPESKLLRKIQNQERKLSQAKELLNNGKYHEARDIIDPLFPE